MSTEENKANERRFFEEAWNQGNTTVFDELLAADFRKAVESWGSYDTLGMLQQIGAIPALGQAS